MFNPYRMPRHLDLYPEWKEPLFDDDSEDNTTTPIQHSNEQRDEISRSLPAL